MDETDSCYEYEPMDVDRSGSTISKMDISCVDSDTDSFEYVDLTNDNESCCSVPKSSPRLHPTLKSTYLVINQDFERENNPKVKMENSEGENTSKIPPRRKIKELTSKMNIRKYHYVKKEPVQESSKFKKIVSYGAILFCLFALCYQVFILNLNCVGELNIINVRKSFTENLFGQNTAANKIIEVLNQHESSKIMFLYGGTGVGKTYAVSLMLENLWNSANIYHYTMPSFTDTFSPELMFGLTLCKSSFVVVDGLNKNDGHIKPHIINLIAKSENLGKNITVILIYSCDNVSDNFEKKCDDHFEMELIAHFNDVPALKHVIKFNPLTEEHLKKCVEKELGDKKVDKHEMKKILKIFNVAFDGCKGVYKKIKFMNV